MFLVPSSIIVLLLGLILTSFWRISLYVYYSGSLISMTSLTFLSVWKYLYFISTFEDYFHWWSWQGFSFSFPSILKISFHCLLLSMFLLKNQLQNYFKWVYCIVFSDCFKIYLLPPHPHRVILECALVWFSLCLSHLGFLTHLKSVDLKFFTSFGKF